MPYIRYKGRMYNVTSSSYIDDTPRIYSFDRYTGTQFSDVTQLDNRNDIVWNGYLDGEAATNIGYAIEYWAKQHYYDSDLIEWPVLRILTSDSIDDYYIEWSHSNPMYLIIKANGHIEPNAIPFIWDDTINFYEGVPRFNTCRARCFTTCNNKDELLNGPYYYGSFNPNDATGAWFTRVQSIKQFLITDALKTNSGSASCRYRSSGGNYLNAQFTFNCSSGYDTDNNFIVSYVMQSSTSQSLMFYWISINDFTSVTNSVISNGGRFTYNTQSSEIIVDGVTYKVTSTFPWTSSDGSGWVSYGVPLSNLTYNDINFISGVDTVTSVDDAIRYFNTSVELSNQQLYYYLSAIFGVEPPSDVDPEDIPPEDEPVTPIPPDDPDPYYDPESDPTSPSYDPVKDPTSPSYDPSVPATPYQPVIQQTIIEPAPIITPPSPVPAPETPSTYVNTSRLFTIFTPTVSQLTDFANFLWASPTDIVPTFRKIVANPMDCVLGLMVIPQLSFTRQSRELNIGNIGTGITMDYAPSQFVDFDCGQLFLQEYYRSYLDYSPYTKVDIFLPFIGTRELSIDECMQKTIGVSYRFDLATGTCVAFIKVNGTVLYQFEGNCASHIPLSSADWGSTVKAVPTIAAAAIKAGGLIGGGPIGTLGVAAAASVMSMKERHPHAGSMSGSAGLMGVLYPYLIVTRPCQALPESQNSFTGYPSFITLSLGDCSGYTEVEQVHLEHVPATGDELIEIERLLKEGVLF